MMAPLAFDGRAGLPLDHISAVAVDAAGCHLVEGGPLGVGDQDLLDAGLDRTVDHIEDRIHQLVPETDVGGDGMSNCDNCRVVSFSKRDTSGAVLTPFNAAATSRKGNTSGSASTEVTFDPSFSHTICLPRPSHSPRRSPCGRARAGSASGSP